MQHGYIKIAAAVPQLHLADPAANAAEACVLIARAAESGVRVLVFPALSLTGVTCGDLSYHQPLLSAARQALCTVAEATKDRELLCFVGLPLQEDGEVIPVTAAVYDGAVLGFVPKGEAPETLLFEGKAIPCRRGLCFTHPDYPDLTVSACRNTAAALQCLPGAAFEIAGGAAARRAKVQAASRRNGCAVVCVNPGPGESSQDRVYAGHAVAAQSGEILAEMQWQHGLLVAEIALQAPISECVARCEAAAEPNLSPAPFLPEEHADDFCREILRLQAEGLRRRMEHAFAKKLVIGVSGGLDSTLALLVAARALDLSGRPREDLLAVTMPCFGTTARTRSNAEILSERLGADFMTVDIRAAVEQHFADIGHDSSVTDVTYENSQARERTQVLMDLANRFGGMVVGTGDLSELALGWATYNGDHMSMYGVNAGLPKTLVRRVVEVFAADCADSALRESLLDVVATPVSPELLPPDAGNIAQKTEDLVGPYELHDFYLYYTLTYGFGPAKIFRLAQSAFAGIYEEPTILKWLETFFRRFFAQQFKRSCLPDGVAPLAVSLSPRGGFAMPSDASRGAWQAELDALREVVG